MMSLDQELMADIDMKYGDSYVLDHEDNWVLFLHRDGPEGVVLRQGGDDYVRRPLSYLFQPNLPWGYTNNLTGVGYILANRTGGRTVKKGVCNNNTSLSTRLSFNTLRAFQNMSYSSWERLSTGNKRGALSRWIGVNGDALCDTNGNIVGTIRDGGVLIRRGLNTQYKRWLVSHIDSVVGSPVAEVQERVVEAQDIPPSLDEIRSRIRPNQWFVSTPPISNEDDEIEEEW